MPEKGDRVVGRGEWSEGALDCSYSADLSALRALLSYSLLLQPSLRRRTEQGEREQKGMKECSHGERERATEKGRHPANKGTSERWENEKSKIKFSLPSPPSLHPSRTPTPIISLALLSSENCPEAKHSPRWLARSQHCFHTLIIISLVEN